MNHAYVGMPYKTRMPQLYRSAARSACDDKYAKPNICRDTANVLSEGAVVGWFRAVPNSVPAARQPQHPCRPAHPRDEGHLNNRVKHRSRSGRCPIVLAERAKDVSRRRGIALHADRQGGRP